MPDMERRKISALRVTQWLKGWDELQFDETMHRRKPEPHFYIFGIRAGDLKALSGIYPRRIEGGLPRAEDLGIQRKHDPERSLEIHEFVEFGFPWSDLSEAKRSSGDYSDLRKPGWLPTSIVVNILLGTDTRQSRTVAPEDLVNVEDVVAGRASIILPANFKDFSWKYQVGHLPPIEIIDGQHRLGAFSEGLEAADYELPVVAFHGLDVSWQAYLFYTINIKPKKINASLAFDMYPLLRTEDWLERFEGHSVYRETRAQELTEALWAHPESPWKDRINMLGERGRKYPSQAGWVRSLLASYVRRFDYGRVGGLFGAEVGEDKLVLPWSRAQQAAFLIYLWQRIRDAVVAEKSEADFAGPYSLLNQDQGIRAVLQVTNDLCFLEADRLRLKEWSGDILSSASDIESVSTYLRSVSSQPFHAWLISVADGLATFDWRSASFPGLTGEQELLKRAFRGSSGYLALRKEVLKHLKGLKNDVAACAGRVMEILKY
jgi:DGQHR domain-containing protein